MCVATRAPDQFLNTLPATQRSKNCYLGMTQPVRELKSSWTCLQSPPLTGRSPSSLRRPPLVEREPLQGAKASKKGQPRPILSPMHRHEQAGKLPPALREQINRAGTPAVPMPSSRMKWQEMLLLLRNCLSRILMLQQQTDRRWQLSRPWGQGACPTHSNDTDPKPPSLPQSLLLENLGCFLVS